VNHPNLIGFYGYFDDSENLYLLYELGCDGQLFKKLKQSKTFSEEAVAFIIRQVL
jgi:serine/threonine protein kinase